MNNLLYQVYRTASAKYRKFKKRLNKNVACGRFSQFSRRKQAQLLHKIERLRKRVLQLHAQLKLAAAGAAFGIMLNATPAEAQTAIGPYKKNFEENPLPPPLPFSYKPTNAYVDLDGDGDLDLVSVHYYNNSIRYFKNAGTKNKARFVELEYGEVGYPFTNLFTSFATYERPVSAAFSDVDADGDFDLLLGTTKYGQTHFFRNNGDSTSPAFEDDFTSNPFLGVGVASGYRPYPAFADVDADGDDDLVVGGYYGSYATYGRLVQFFKNEDGVFTLQPYPDNPFFFSGPDRGVFVGFADMDKDGDLDFVLNSYDYYNTLARFYYRRNDGYGVFTEQSGTWLPDSGNPSNSSGNPFEVINQESLAPTFINFAFADLDDDGDPDVTLSYYDQATYSEIRRSYFYYQNDGSGGLKGLSGLESPVDGVDMGDIANAALVDVDSDGDLDIIASGTRSAYYSEMTYYYGFTSTYLNSSNKFIPATEAPPFSIANLNLRGRSRIKIIDVDIDGDLDVVVPYYDGNYSGNYGQVQYFRNDDGVFNEQTGGDNPFKVVLDYQVDSGLLYRSIDLDLADLDHDGKPDLILAVENVPLKVYRNVSDTNNPQFESMPDWEAGIEQTAYLGGNPTLIDLDNDGDMDIVEGKYNNIWYYENDGDAEQPDFIQILPYDYVNSNDQPIDAKYNPFKDIEELGAESINPTLLDADGDGDVDLLLGLGDGTFSYYKNENPAPVTTIASTLAVTPGGAPVILDSNITTSDPDNDLIARVTVTIANFKTGEEVLTFTPQGNITGTFDATKGVLTLTGSADASEYVAVLKTVAYQFTGAKPAASGKKSFEGGKTITLNRSISFSVFDADFTTPAPSAIAVQMTFANAVPALTASSSAPTFISTPVAVDPGVTVADGDDADLAGATVAIDPTKLKSAEDELVFSNQNGISGSYNAATGILTLSGTSSVANYQAALRSVQYRNNAAAATNQPRIITFVVNDGEVNSNTTAITVNVNVNSPPVISPNPVTTQIGSLVTVDLSTLITDPNNNTDLTTLKVITQPLSGANATITNGILSVDYANTEFAGQDVVRVEVCDLSGACTQADITINVEGDIIVHNAFSPNGDGFNQAWHISNITSLEPKNKVSIFTRWGDKIFEIDDYNNNDRVFDGTSDSGKQVASGTYFYKIEFPSGRETLTGYLVIKR